MKSTLPSIRFEKSGYFFIGLLLLAFLGFWNSYFSGFFSGQFNYSFYFHFHAIMMILWVVLLIVQPLLIRNKMLSLHKSFGKLSYVIMPLLLLSVFLIMHHGLKKVPIENVSFKMIMFPVRDIIVLIIAYGIGILYRRNYVIHSRAMILTGIVFIEPALIRFLRAVFPKEMDATAILLCMVFILGLLIALSIMDRKGRWFFIGFLIINVLVYTVMSINISLTFLDPFAQWFAGLSLT